MPPASQTIASGSRATLSVTASGTDPLTYQWFENWSNTPIPDATSANYVTPPLTETSYYWVRVINSCGRANSATATVTVFLPPPSNLIATMSSTTQIAVSWTISQGADHYELERKFSGLPFVKIADVVSGSYVDSTVSSGATYLYRVRAANAGATVVSAYSNSDLATTMSFSPIVSEETEILSAHFVELLNALNAVRSANGSPPLTWTALLPPGVPAPAPGVDIYAAHVTNLRSRMDAALLDLGLPIRSYIDPVLDNSIFIRREHVVELRERTQ